MVSEALVEAVSSLYRVGPLALRAGFSWPSQSQITATRTMNDMLISRFPYWTRWVGRAAGKLYSDLHIVTDSPMPTWHIFKRLDVLKAIKDFVRDGSTGLTIHHHRPAFSGEEVLKQLMNLGDFPDGATAFRQG